jgi:hypothetical protein
MFFDHRAHPFDGAAADALLFGFAVDDVAGSGNRHTGQPSDITEFQPGFSLFFDACGRILADPTPSGQTTIVGTCIRPEGLQGCDIIE